MESGIGFGSTKEEEKTQRGINFEEEKMKTNEEREEDVDSIEDYEDSLEMLNFIGNNYLAVENLQRCYDYLLELLSKTNNKNVDQPNSVNGFPYNNSNNIYYGLNNNSYCHDFLEYEEPNIIKLAPDELKPIKWSDIDAGLEQSHGVDDIDIDL